MERLGAFSDGVILSSSRSWFLKITVVCFDGVWTSKWVMGPRQTGPLWVT